VEDDPDFAAITADFRERESERIEVETATDPAQGLERVRERDPHLPFVLFTGRGSEEVASEALSADATNYLQKKVGTDQYAILANRIENAVDQRRSVTDRRRAERRFEAIFQDPNLLVGLLDTDGTLVDCNDTALSFVDVDRETLRGQPFWETP